MALHDLPVIFHSPPRRPPTDTSSAAELDIPEHAFGDEYHEPVEEEVTFERMASSRRPSANGPLARLVREPA